MNTVRLNSVQVLAVTAMLFLTFAASAQVYDLTEGIVYGEAKGREMILDIFTPTGAEARSYWKPGDSGKGLGIIDIVSGGWNDSDARRAEHDVAGVFNILCARGYTVFAVRPGGLPEFTGLEMVANIQRAIRWVKANADEYGVDPERLGMIGASAGGHLALLTMLDPLPAQEAAEDPLERFDTTVKAVGTFFPPTDFLDWNGGPAIYQRHPHLMFSDGLEGKTQEEQDAMAARLSPRRLVRGATPPVFLVHGDDDDIVPLQQSQIMVDTLREVGTDVSLVVREGAGHFWITIFREIVMAVDWLDEKLRD